LAGEAIFHAYCVNNTRITLRDTRLQIHLNFAQWLFLPHLWFVNQFWHRQCSTVPQTKCSYELAGAADWGASNGSGDIFPEPRGDVRNYETTKNCNSNMLRVCPYCHDNSRLPGQGRHGADHYLSFDTMFPHGSSRMLCSSRTPWRLMPRPIPCWCCRPTDRSRTRRVMSR